MNISPQSDCGIVFIDKSTWPDGPWQQEPDKLEFVDIHTGLPCLIRRNETTGCLCGYVSVPLRHPFYDRQLDQQALGPINHCCEDEWCKCSPEYIFRVHGGLTYAGESRACQGGVELTHSLVGGDGIGWWFGFDAAHAHDLMPAYFEFPRELLSGSFTSVIVGSLTYRDIAYMKGECAELAQQIVEVARV